MNTQTVANESVKSARRVLEIFELFTATSKPMSFSTCQARLGYPKASLHGLLRTLTAARWLAFDPASKEYTLGVRVWEAGVAYAGTMPLDQRALPIMTRLRDQTTETVQLAVLDAFDVLYVAKVDGEHMLRLESAVGRRLEPHASGVGKVLLAGLDDHVLLAWLEERSLKRFTSTTIVEAEKLMAELRSVRDKGYAIDREERTLGASCVAVGIRNHLNIVVAAMSVSAPAVRFGSAQRSAALVHLRAAAEELSAVLGHIDASAWSGPQRRSHVKPQGSRGVEPTEASENARERGRQE